VSRAFRGPGRRDRASGHARRCHDVLGTGLLLRRPGQPQAAERAEQDHRGDGEEGGVRAGGGGHAGDTDVPRDAPTAIASDIADTAVAR
jgi:hypothetical protein